MNKHFFTIQEQYLELCRKIKEFKKGVKHTHWEKQFYEIELDMGILHEMFFEKLEEIKK